MVSSRAAPFAPFLMIRSAQRLCALPLDGVVETMRALRIEGLAGAPPFVSGLSIVRGEAMPVVHLAHLLTGELGTTPSRFVVVELARDRRVCLAVDEVLGVRGLDPDRESDLPPLLRDAGAASVAALRTLDGELLWLLRAARIVPDPVWQALDERASQT